MKEARLPLVPITSELMCIDTRRERIDIQQIENRRFMYDPRFGVLILGKQWRGGLHQSHAEELAEAGIVNDYDAYVRGWIGVSKSYPQGIIHFAPCVDSRNFLLFERAFRTLEMFISNGAVSQTVIRGFGREWEQPAAAIFPKRIAPISLEQSKPLSDHKKTQKRKEPSL